MKRKVLTKYAWQVYFAQRSSSPEKPPMTEARIGGKARAGGFFRCNALLGARGWMKYEVAGEGDAAAALALRLKQKDCGDIVLKR